MNKTRFIYMFLILVISSGILCGCKDQVILKEKMKIDIEFSKDIIPYSLFISSIDSIPIINDYNSYLSTIEDICISDSSLFILDASSNLLSVNIFTGKVNNMIKIKGHSNSECISPKAISCTNENVYILDMNGKKIVMLDSNLDYIDYIPTTVSAMDFVVIPKGFLLFNLNCDEDNDLVLCIDRTGKIMDKFIDNTGIPELILYQQIFSETKDGVTIVPPLQNKMFKYDNKADTVSYDIKYVFSSKTENKGKDEDIFPIPNAAIIAFESERYIITNYLANQMIGTCIYDKKNEVVNSGLVSTETLYPFTPMVLKENILYGVYDRHLVFDDKNDYIIVKYELKK